MHDAGLDQGLGNTEVIASGKPLSPSTTAIRMSWVPRLRISVITRSQNFAPSVCSIQRPRISSWPQQRTPIARYTAPVVDHALVADLHLDRVEEHDGVGRVQPAALPRRNFLRALRRSPRCPVQFADVGRDLPRRHPRAYSAVSLSSMPANRRRYFPIGTGSKRPCRSRGIESLPESVSRVLEP